MGLLQIDLRNILRHRIPDGKGNLVPGFIYSWLERLIHQDELNDLLKHAYPKRGSEFAQAILSRLNMAVEVEGLDSLPAEGSYVFASNHPLGGLDGIALIAVLGDMFGDSHVRFLVNDMLMNVEPLTDVFLPINKYGAQGRGAAVAIDAAFENPHMQIAVFPAGLVSRLGDDRRVADLKWQKSFAAKALRYGRTVVPVRFVALNRKRFYRMARLRTKSGLKVNLEQALLPSELCAMRGGRLRIIFGRPIDADGMTHAELTAATRAAVYSLLPPETL